MEIRRAVKKDFSQIKKLFLESQEYESTLDKNLVVNVSTEKTVHRLIEEIFKNPERRLFVAKDNGEIAGYVWATFCPGMETGGWIADVYVCEPFRRRGIGSKLTMSAFDWMKQRGATKVSLTAYKNDKGALSFYRKLKFESEPPKFVNFFKKTK